MATVVLRQWQDSDLEPFAEMNANPEVMRYFLAPLSRSEAADWLARMRSAIDEKGWGIWAVDADGEFAGMMGLAVPRWPLPFLPCTEILWRFRREYWGRSVAYAAGRLALDHGFSRLGLAEIVAYTTPPNARSIRLMERLGFARDQAGDFEHPALPEGHALRRHVLYRQKAPHHA